ncbi:hypothetical protein BU24DRAFT_443328 [Aaosphaeria arxii CBS 175.79]|uniref:FAD-binding PCMH-type domain-containing protein n=1 Tax=Aaosphaeria arxii CBS 175.79 TaxID=1450172 RepID=A0A6A5XFM7_9PLEO|nr:uncharacterized protein BU24DRAFT_443328 [Aaosphaeria arxii CBS 175.79]KAF2011948.1 hypothetical protein BU24DRAFT_443328 [Aaosphaeria arxii CBS 175.79]
MSQSTTLPARSLERTHILKQILEHIEEFSDDSDEVDYAALKEEVLKPVIAERFDPEVQLRGFLRTFQHTITYRKAYSNIKSPELRGQIDAFVNGKHAKDVTSNLGFDLLLHKSPGVQHHFSLLEELKKLLVGGLELKAIVKDIFHPKHKYVKDLPVVYEGIKENSVVECYSQVPFENWGLTVKDTPRYTFLPNTVNGVKNVVKYALKNNYRVRCAGYRHSWSSIFSQDNEILISFVNLHTVTTLPDPMSIVPGEYDPSKVPELKTIDLKEETVPGKHRLCRVGAAVTNEEFRRWAVAGKAWSLPADVILVEVTIGGVNGPICHGAGISHKTLSDYVRRIEYVDCLGNLQAVDDPQLIKAAAGAFGLLGVVTHITFELDAMTYAIMKPLKEDVGLGVPPLSKKDIPIALRGDWYNAPDADQQIAKATEEFKTRAANDYYTEWFWFTYQRKIWTNTFNTTADPTGAVNYPDDGNVFLQWIQGWLGGVITEVPLFNAIPGYWQAQLIASLGMAALPPTLGETKTPTYKTLLPDALHFRRGVQNMRVRDLELQIPLPPRSDDPTKPDFSIVQRAWWDVIKLVYRDAETGGDPSSAMRLALEMRLMGGSDMLLAPQKGNDLGTLSIEVLTLPDAVADNEWHGFVQKVVDLWTSYGGNVRPHWAKEWEGINFKGMDARKYLKDVAYRDQIPEFRDALVKIGETQGWTIDQLQKRFSNELWDKLVFE